MSKSDDAVVVGRASPAFSADEDVHNPSVDGLRCESGRSKVDGFRLSAFFESALCFDVAVEWSSLLHLLCRAFDRFIGRG